VDAQQREVLHTVKVDQSRPTAQSATVTRVRPLRVAKRDRYERPGTVAVCA
jgi:hypothetical protein